MACELHLQMWRMSVWREVDDVVQVVAVGGYRESLNVVSPGSEFIYETLKVATAKE